MPRMPITSDERTLEARQFQDWGHPTTINAQSARVPLKEVAALAARAKQLRSLAANGLAPGVLLDMATEIDVVVEHLRGKL